ncbi:MAG: hypothetical protein H7A44_13810 [Opitutaceae bacterium]|nr:hypothetical protein [Opitutaceae bacterium]
MRRLLILLFCLTGVGSYGQTVRIAGSDLLARDLTPVLQAMADREERDVAVDFTGSHAAWQALQSGGADLGVLSLAPDQPPPDASFHVVPVAWQTVVVLAPATVQLNQISFAQLAGVFGAGEGSDWKRWGDLGVTGEMAPRSVTPWVLERPPLPTLGLFRHVVLRSRPLGSALRTETEATALIARLTSPEGGLALAARPPEPAAGIKVLPVSTEPDGVAFAPTTAAIERGDYPLQWPVYLVFRRADVSRLYPWLRFLLSDQAAAALTQAGLHPAAPDTRRREVFALEEL